MTEIQNPKHEYNFEERRSQLAKAVLISDSMFRSRAAQALAPRVEYCYLRFICNLVLGI